MKTLRIITVTGAALIVLLALQACTAGMQLIPKTVDSGEMTGTYDLILYGCRYPKDLENMAILVDTRSPYPLEVYSLKGMYTVRTGLSGPLALQEANAFVKCGINPVWQTTLRKISVGEKTIGYEVKPLYRDISPAEAEISQYTLRNGKIIAYLRLEYSLDQDYGDGNRDHDSH